MATLTADPNIVPNAVARLTQMYRTKPVIRAIVEVFAERWANFESVMLELYTKQWLDDAEGDLLDALGEIVGEPRLGRADELYKLWIRARITINRGHGKIAGSYKLVRLIAGHDVRVRYIPTPPAAYTMDVDNLPDNVNAEEVFALLDEVRPAGVRMNLEYSPDADLETIFTLSDTNTEILGDNDKGLGDSGNAAIGGRLRGVL